MWGNGVPGGEIKRQDKIRVTLSTEPQKMTLAPLGRPRLGIEVHSPGSNVSVNVKGFILHGKIFKLEERRVLNH